MRARGKQDKKVRMLWFVVVCIYVKVVFKQTYASHRLHHYWKLDEIRQSVAIDCIAEFRDYCQAKVQVQSLKSKAMSKVKSKVLSLRTWTLASTKIIQPTHPPTHHPPQKLFKHFQRSYSQVLYLFGNLS